MANQPAFTKFRVEGLRGQRTIEAKIEDNTLILVGENGSGKTTFLRLMFNFLSGRWHNLSQFKFERIEAVINGVHFEVRGDEIAPYSTFDQNTLRSLPPVMRRRLREAEEFGRWDEVQMLQERFLGRHRASELDDVKLGRLQELQTMLSTTMSAQILYLPTYRRIERELSSIFRGIDTDDFRKNRNFETMESGDSFIELVEFGMGDVERAIKSALENIRTFANAGLNGLTLSYLGDVVSQSYLSTTFDDITQVSEETVSSVLDRISSAILKDENKAHLQEIVMNARKRESIPSEHEKIILHYFSKLLKFQSQLQKKESDIRAFCDLASNYIVDKKFVYDAQRFSFRIEWARKVSGHRKRAASIPDSRERPGDVELPDLSSGEKQIVSLFSHLYLSGKDKYFVLIDEPELSLSVPWQRRFLEDIRSASFCTGLVAVTHSPFIYDNGLRKHTHALGEFIRGSDWGNIQ